MKCYAEMVSNFCFGGAKVSGKHGFGRRDASGQEMGGFKALGAVVSTLQPFTALLKFVPESSWVGRTRGFL
jgi:hypothetical protein